MAPHHPHSQRWQQAVQHLLAVRRPGQAEQLARRRVAEHPQETGAHRQLANSMILWCGLPT